MIKLERTANWYRPYTVVASGKEYLLENIHFYDENGIVASSGGGWLQNINGMDIKEIELPVDKVIRRNKKKFDGEVFGITYRSYNETRLVLYIPIEMFHIEYDCKRKMYGDRIYECYKGDYNIYLTKYVESLDANLRLIQNDYSALYESVGLFDMERNPDLAIEKLQKMIKTIESFKEERKNIDSIVVGG
jgi:hypothetical protein